MDDKNNNQRNVDNPKLLWRGYDDFVAYQAEDVDELMEYLCLHAERSGLPVNCFSDDGGAYIRHDHPLFFYMCNGYGLCFDMLPLTVDDDPKVMLSNYELKISQSDFEKVRDFIKVNKENIIKLANDELVNTDFLKLIK